jgi:hypothetical protein
MANPILESKIYESEYDGRVRFTVEGGLHYIKGNIAPYFSLTYWERTTRGRDIGGGAGHDTILQHFPKYADMAALHLCDIDGAPTSTVENGLYYLGATEWQGFDAGAVSRHFRISESDALTLARDIFGIYFSPTVGVIADKPRYGRSKFYSVAVADARTKLVAWVDSQRARWKAEADSCIAKHGLVVYGDNWPIEKES